MLINPRTLNARVTHLTRRNRLIQQLLTSPLDSKTNISKWILAAWLGSNVTLSVASFSTAIAYFACYVDYGYFVCHLLDRLGMNPLGEAHSRVISHRTLLKIIHYFNKHAHDIHDMPKIVFIEFLKIVKEGQVQLSSNDREAQNVFNCCASFLSRGIQENRPEGRINSSRTLQQLIKKSNNCGFNYIPTIINRCTTAAAHHETFNVAFHADLFGVHLCKILLESKGEQIIDGLYIEPFDKKLKQTVVISLIGHFPAESHYIGSYALTLFNIFQTAVLLINHRNFSDMSTAHAKNLNDLVKDTQVFVDYFRAQGKDIVLYGMCGGTATMILTAYQLALQKIPFKLIVDRASQRYVDWVSMNTAWRLITFNPQVATLLYFIFCIILFIGGLRELLLFVAQSDTDFGEVLKQLPKEHVLILQGKDRKTLPNHSIDNLVHPSNDLRQIFKKERHQERQMLKELKQLALDIAMSATTPSNHCVIFNRLANCFDHAVQLIDNEKLKWNKKFLVQGRDIHTFHLSLLETRHRLEFTHLFHGFFKKPTKSCKIMLDAFKIYDTFDILRAMPSLSLFHNRSNSLEQERASRLVNNLYRFFEQLVTHKQYIGYIGDRMYMSGMADLELHLRELFNSELITQLEESYYFYQVK